METGSVHPDGRVGRESGECQVDMKQGIASA